MRLPQSFLLDTSGATAIEYGLLCAGIGLLILVALNTTGAALLEKLTYLSELLL
jgi:pilus assembly protein Flp/PilA